MHAVEQELIAACSFKPRKKYNNRQEYLRAILMAANKLSDDEFDTLSDDAAKWVDACVKTHNASKEEDLPDFDEAEASDDDNDEADETDAEEADDSEDADEDEAEDAADESAEGDDEGDAEDPEDDPDEEDPEDDEPELDLKPAPKKPVKAAKPEPAPKKAPKVVEATPKKKPKPADDDDDVILDKWGCMTGSKNSQALAMFEKGATSKEVRDAIGGTYYNIIGKMAQAGHTVEKEGHLIKLTHKNDSSAPKAKKSKK